MNFNKITRQEAQTLIDAHQASHPSHAPCGTRCYSCRVPTQEEQTLIDALNEHEISDEDLMGLPQDKERMKKLNNACACEANSRSFSKHSNAITSDC